MEKRVRAVIIRDGAVFLIRRKKGDTEYWVFPGGGLETSDATPQDGLKRECKEEIGVDVSVGCVFAEKALEGPNPQIEIFFLCTITGGIPGIGQGPEYARDPARYGTYEPEWVPIQELASREVLPKVIREKVTAAFGK